MKSVAEKIVSYAGGQERDIKDHGMRIDQLGQGLASLASKVTVLSKQVAYYSERAVITCAPTALFLTAAAGLGIGQLYRKGWVDIPCPGEPSYAGYNWCAANHLIFDSDVNFADRLTNSVPLVASAIGAVSLGLLVLGVTNKICDTITRNQNREKRTRCGMATVPGG